MRRMIRATALFAVYSGIGFGGEWAVGLLAQERAGADRRLDEEVVVDVEPAVDVVVEVEPEVVVDVRVRTDGACRYGVTREAAIPAGAIERLVIDAGSGALRVEGRAGLEEIRARADVCATLEAWLDELRVRATQDGEEATITTHYPDRSGWTGRGTASIDLTVLVPLGLAVDIEDSSGEMEVSGTGDLRIEDSSGSIRVHGIDGHLSIDDSSGDLRIEGVAGDVQVDDGSGGVAIRDVRGSVAIRDGSGGVEISGVERSVLVDGDGSGEISVREIGGDFVVDGDGSGSITYVDVAGAVEIPEHKRKRRRRPGR